jgi:hypothetical protein
VVGFAAGSAVHFLRRAATPRYLDVQDQSQYQLMNRPSQL